MRFLNGKTMTALAAMAMVFLSVQSIARADGAVVERVPVESAVATCDGSLVVLSGEFLTVTQTTTDENGGIHGVMHVNTSGLVGTDPATGATYRGNATYSSAFNFSTDGAKETTASQTFVVVGQGQASNLLFRYQFKITVNANGEVSTTFANIVAECH